ncbi:MAG TPA: alpha/beta hydrolase [Thermomicrobiales bacterium]|nr:alpha/beta hydrolase [Thermomicrobiales bacterium]
MPIFTSGDVSLHYEEYGAGYPLLLFAPGGMRSTIDFWHGSPFDPTAEFAGDFRVIAMDQRNAGSSRAPLDGNDWATYTADHLALLDHLGIARCHIMGGCIGSSYCLGLIQAAPERVSAAVLQNPIGLSPSGDNREDFLRMFDEWAAELRRERPDANDATLPPFRDRMFGGDFVFSVSRDFARACPAPLLVLAGDDNFHPTATAREIVTLAPRAELLLAWKTPDVVGDTVKRVRAFLQAHMPVAVAGR